ncbi:glycoside hydrolase family 95 protein [Echinicola marina]|uniref:glycosyl hydrolase family 95 catalytic domain-containing protein n=1 Tax=Echinicola marina TaxID=2859768 RepID=UPI001CF67C4F|nr:glycoside hydrolase N-terminal domain-containing protein [Echinicola marina]UCS92085.1 glycoside hydrolase family 95 protein [Echinicola marina]
MKSLPLLIFYLLLISCSLPEKETINIHKDLQPYNLNFSYIPTTWDEGLPLGNGEIGALVWQNQDKLRMSLDHVDLWDLRKMENLDGEEYKFSWVKEQWEKDEYKKVQELFDVPYNRAPAPSKIRGAALEFATEKLGKVTSSRLDIASATVKIEWSSGATLSTFVHADRPIGWFKLEGKDVKDLIPNMIAPTYNLESESKKDQPIARNDLRRLGYPQGTIMQSPSEIVYIQPGWDGFEYQITVRWENTSNGIEGCWSITTNLTNNEKDAKKITTEAIAEGFDASIPSHLDWWAKYWNKSSLQVPDSILQKQWYLEQYKFGAAARENTPPISLQAVWTADNGKLPPWKGDFHHDLNTQLSYWPSYTSNHLDLAKGYLNWLWENYPTFKTYTETYFETNGINVPGVGTLTGAPMGGWIQYAFGPTVSAWLSHHFYLHWRYSMDREFLKEEAYPWFKEVAIYLDEISEKTEDGKRKLPISASPEMHNNSRRAWFGETTNFDLANIRFAYTKAAELARELGLDNEAKKWEAILAEWPDYAIDETGMMVAPGEALNSSHRHFSHLMAIHPLSMINWSDGDKAQTIIKNTLENLKTVGSSAWVGYSFSWLGNLQARALDGEGAAETLKIFASSFCLPNSFHVNGDQSGKGYSNLNYRPFTLEGNFAFAAGLQEMLLQSHEDFIRLFPAIPKDWEKASFNGFLAQGNFEISAEKINHDEIQAVINSPKGGTLKIINPFGEDCKVNGQALTKGNVFSKAMKVNESLELTFKK